MKMFKKTTLLVLALGVVGTLGLAACGGGDKGGTDNGNAKGEQVTLEQWTAAMTASYAADNVTANVTVSAAFTEEEMMVGGSATGAIKIANDVIYEAMSYTESMGELSYTYTDETFIINEDGTYYEWYKDSIDTLEWVTYESEDAKYNPYFSTTLGGYVLREYMGSVESSIAIYDRFEYNASTGEYTATDSSEGESMTISVKIANGKLYTLETKYVEGDEYETMKIVFTNYGTTTIGKLPNGEEAGGGEEISSAPSQGGSEEISSAPSQSGSEEIGGGEEVDFVMPEFDFDNTLGNDIVGAQVSTDELSAAIDKALAATNFTMKGHSFVQGGRSLVQSNVANGKSYNVTRATYPTTEGETETTEMHMIIGEVDGTAYAWMSFDEENWDCELADEVVVGGWQNGSDVFGDYLSMFKMLTPTFDQSTGAYSVSVEGMTVSIKIVNGAVKMIHLETTDMYITEVIEFGNAVNFKLPPVTIGGEGGEGGNEDGPSAPEVGGEVIVPEGEQVNKETWDAAIKETMAATNFSIQAQMLAYLEGRDELIMDGSMVVQVADNNGYYVQKMSIDGNKSTRYSYMGTVDGKTYNWSSADGENWECFESIYQEINGAWFLEEMFPADLTFENVTFVEEMGAYRYVGEEETVTIGFKDGKVAFVIQEYTAYTPYGNCDERDVWVLTYGDASVKLPPVQVGGDNTDNNTQIGGDNTDNKVEVMG